MPFLWRTDADGADRQQTLVNRAQDRIIEYIKSLQASPLSTARLLTDVAIATSATTVYHGLGRVPRGWSIVGLQTMAIIWETSTARNVSAITLQSSAAATVDILVF
jgi:hypothetical protein